MQNFDYDSSLHVAVVNRNIQEVKYLVHHNHDINYKNAWSQTALMFASVNGTFDIIKYLIKHGALLNEKNHNNRSALNIAQIYGHIRIVKYLIKHGAEINPKIYDVHPFKQHLRDIVDKYITIIIMKRIKSASV